MITHSRNGDRVKLEMGVDEWQTLLLALGYAAGASFRDKPVFWKLVRFANEVNRTNPSFTPYEIPEEFR